MYKIIKKENLADKLCLYEIENSRLAKAAMPGQFLIVKIDEQGERIPFTICDYDREKGTVTIVVQEVGVKLTDAGVSYPYHKNPDNSNIRIALSYPNINDLETALKVFVAVVKYVNIDKLLI